jgi:hypothetical protein
MTNVVPTDEPYIAAVTHLPQQSESDSAEEQSGYRRMILLEGMGKRVIIIGEYPSRNFLHGCANQDSHVTSCRPDLPLGGRRRPLHRYFSPSSLFEYR